MKFTVILLLAGCVFSSVLSKPLDPMDSSEELQDLFTSGELLDVANIMKCGLMTVALKADEIEEFQTYMKSINVTAVDIMSKLGTDQFDISAYKNTCTEVETKANSFLLSMRNEFATCADDDIMNVVDLVLDFAKNLGNFQCNLSEKELSYFAPELSDSLLECANESKQKLSKCLVEKDSNAIDNDNGKDMTLQEALCKVDLAASGQCIKNTFSECGEESARGVNLILDFAINYAIKKLDCPVEVSSGNSV